MVKGFWRKTGISKLDNLYPIHIKTKCNQNLNKFKICTNFFLKLKHIFCQEREYNNYMESWSRHLLGVYNSKSQVYSGSFIMVLSRYAVLEKNKNNKTYSHGFNNIFKVKNASNQNKILINAIISAVIHLSNTNAVYKKNVNCPKPFYIV